MLPNWEIRPKITAYLMNPAFCSEIIRGCAIAYQSEANEDLPYSLSVLVLPFILNDRISERLPKTKSNTIHDWIIKNEELKIILANCIRSLIPFSNEAIMFAIAHKTLGIENDGTIRPVVKSTKSSDKMQGINKYYKRSKILGKVLANSGTPATIYSILGIKP